MRAPDIVARRVSALVDAKDSDSDLASGRTTGTILGIERDAARHRSGRGAHQPVHKTPSAFYERQ